MRTASRPQASDRLAAVALGCALALAAAGGVHRLVGPAPRAAAPAATAPAAPPRAEKAAPLPSAAVVTAAAPRAGDAAPLPGSLAGTEEDGALREDGAGALIVGPEVLRLFDYYLSATGEEADAKIEARVRAAIREKLGERRAAAEANDLFDRYLRYRRAAGRVSAAGDDLEARLDALRKLRRDSFGALADRLFGEDERAVAAALEQRRVLADRALSAEDRERRLGEIEDRMPDAVREARAAAVAPIRAREEEEAMRAAGAGPETIRAYRVATFGEEAAERLGELDARRDAWKGRLTAFREARAAVLRDEPDAARAQAAVAALLERSFSPLERIRVEAADRIEAETAGVHD